ncbi:hypothetical protein Y1Q_0024687 [Alligator mississippiensis]|uniref:Uncharacterized protein n=1 Tax=Alligator mississippiensis TaxID=8496 RepID=A0A151PH12_ALLMI|nr:hypothetical protein Y1Q_0024687 [Alligator mississippiensis]
MMIGKLVHTVVDPGLDPAAGPPGHHIGGAAGRLAGLVHEWEKDWERDRVDQKFWDRLLALENRHLEAQKWQAAMVARVVEAMEEDCQVLDAILALAITFLPPAAQPPTTAPPAP